MRTPKQRTQDMFCQKNTFLTTYSTLSGCDVKGESAVEVFKWLLDMISWYRSFGMILASGEEDNGSSLCNVTLSRTPVVSMLTGLSEDHS